MSEKLESYLDEIGRYLSGREEREEILKEIRGHILEKSELEYGDTTEASLEKAISGYGPPRRVAEKYLDGTQLIPSAYKRHLVRYTSLVFAAHMILVLIGLLGRQSIMFFPLFVPRMNAFETIAYIPMAFFFDLGLVGLVLYIVTRSRKDVRLPWPKVAIEPEKAKSAVNPAGRIAAFLAVFAVTIGAIVIYLKYETLFFFRLDFVGLKSLFNPEASHFYSLCLIAVLLVDSAALFAKILTVSPWVKLTKNATHLVILGLLLSRSFENPFVVSASAKIDSILGINFTIVLIIIAVFVARDFLKSLILVNRHRKAKG